MVHTGARRRQNIVTTIVDVQRGQLQDVVPDRTSKAPQAWLEGRGPTWCAGHRWRHRSLGDLPERRRRGAGARDPGGRLVSRDHARHRHSRFLVVG